MEEVKSLFEQVEREDVTEKAFERSVNYCKNPKV